MVFEEDARSLSQCFALMEKNYRYIVTLNLVLSPINSLYVSVSNEL